MALSLPACCVSITRDVTVLLLSAATDLSRDAAAMFQTLAAHRRTFRDQNLPVSRAGGIDPQRQVTSLWMRYLAQASPPLLPAPMARPSG